MFACIHTTMVSGGLLTFINVSRAYCPRYCPRHIWYLLWSYLTAPYLWAPELLSVGSMESQGREVDNGFVAKLGFKPHFCYPLPFVVCLITWPGRAQLEEGSHRRQQCVLQAADWPAIPGPSGAGRARIVSKQILTTNGRPGHLWTNANDALAESL